MKARNERILKRPLSYGRLKAAENCRIPRPVGFSDIPVPREASWSAAVLCCFCICWLGLASSLHAQTNSFRSQIITLPLPFNADASIFVDVDGDGLSDLLALDPAQMKLALYHQRNFGFTNAPDQVIEFPPKTAWATARDVDANPGLELLFSTGDGIVYSRQNAGIFESERRMLIKAEQVFTNETLPILISQATTNAIPVIFAKEAVLYRSDHDFHWRSEAASALIASPAAWSVVQNGWMMGNNSSRDLHIKQQFSAKSKEREQFPQNAALMRLIEEAKKSNSPQVLGTNWLDLNGDGRKDLIFWQAFHGLDAKTDLYVFLQNSEGSFPQRPTQTLHCRGFPIPINSTGEASAIADLKGDGQYEVVLMDLSTAFTSASSILDMALSGGLECTLTIRSFKHGMFSGTPDASMPIRTIMPVAAPTLTEMARQWPFFIHGDFNGDGRPDLMVRRAERWTIYLSEPRGWFKPQPVLTFDPPFEGDFDFKDLNGDRKSDIILRAENDPRICILISP